MATVTVTGLDEIGAAFTAAGADLDDLDTAQSEVGRAAADELATHVPTRSRKLAGSIHSSGGLVTVTVVYAGPILRGWPRHNIRASRAIALTDEAMEVRAPQILENRLEGIFERNHL